MFLQPETQVSAASQSTPLTPVTTQERWSRAHKASKFPPPKAPPPEVDVTPAKAAPQTQPQETSQVATQSTPVVIAGVKAFPPAAPPSKPPPLQFTRWNPDDLTQGELEKQMMILQKRIDFMEAETNPEQFAEVIEDLKNRLTQARQVLYEKHLNIKDDYPSLF